MCRGGKWINKTVQNSLSLFLSPFSLFTQLEKGDKLLKNKLKHKAIITEIFLDKNSNFVLLNSWVICFNEAVYRFRKCLILFYPKKILISTYKKLKIVELIPPLSIYDKPLEARTKAASKNIFIQYIWLSPSMKLYKILTVS